MKRLLIPLLFLLPIIACHKGVRRQEDEIYSRHLQKKVKLTILNTPVPSDKSTLDLLLLNDGQEIQNLHLQEALDSLYKNKLIDPLVVVAIHAGDRLQEYGVAGKPDYQGRGSRAGYYSDFVNDELYPYVKKKSGVRKFNIVAIAGTSLGGLSAFDIAWDHQDKIDKVGVLSGSFWWRDKDNKDSSYDDQKNRIIIGKLNASRRKNHLQYWFYAGTGEETADRDHDGVIDVVDDTKDVINLLIEKKHVAPADITYKEQPGAGHDWPYWQAAFPDFLIWAFGRK